MPQRDLSPFLRRLNDHCARALADAASLCETRAHRDIEVEHWLIKLLELGDGDLVAIVRRYELDVDGIWNGLLAAIDRLPHELRGKPSLSRSLARVLESAWLYASAGDSAQPIRSANLLQAIVDAPHVLRATDAWPLLSVSSTQIQRLLRDLDRYSVEAASRMRMPRPRNGASQHLYRPTVLRRQTARRNGRRPRLGSAVVQTVTPSGASPSI